MRKREDYTRLLVVALVLGLGILVAFQIYLLREPQRIQNVLAADQSEQISRGEKLFADNCATCHGKQGEGDIGPALNSKKFLKGTDNGVIFNLITSGVPGTGMPSWGQEHGGPFTTEQVNDLVGFIRHWEPTAQDVVKASPTPNVAEGQLIFKSTCYACHGVDGQGTDRAPALNSKELLAQFDDQWFHQTIAQGRPSKGMPTWGQVLSPEQINAVVAYIRSWQSTAPSVPPTVPATGSVAPTPVSGPTVEPTVEVARPSNGNLTGGAALALSGDSTKGALIYLDNCKKCHGDAGAGGVDNAGSTDGTVPPLNPIDDTMINSDLKTFAYNVDLFVEHGSTPEGPNPALLMPAWGDDKKLLPQQIADVIAYVIGLNVTSAETPVASTATPAAQAPTETPAAAATEEPARPSNPGGPGEAVNLTGDSTKGALIYLDNCKTCHGNAGTGGVDNAGSTDGTVPPLNPIDGTLISPDRKTYATNLDLFIEHGSKPEGDNPKLLMPAWGDQKKLVPQQIADVIAYIMGLNPASAETPAASNVTPTAQAATETPTVVPTVSASQVVTPTTAPGPTVEPTVEVARPSNGNLTGGAALALSGDSTKGALIYLDNCKKCHGDAGAGGVDNAGSTDGTVPPLNPIDDTMINSDLKTFAYNVDLFVEHGSTPEGPNPALLMPAWGDDKKLLPQQIADVIAYIISLNK